MRPRSFNLDDGQYELLQAISALSPIGKPPVASLIRQAVQEFLERSFQNDPSLREKVEKFLERPKIVQLRSERGPRKR